MDDQSLKFSLEFIKASLPDIDWLIKDINDHGGTLGFPKKFIDLFTYDELSSWAYLYENLSSMKGLMGLQFLGPKRVNKLAEELKTLTGQSLQDKKMSIKSEIMGKIRLGEFDVIKDAEGYEGEDYYNLLLTDTEKRTKFVQSFQAYIPHIFQYLALMTHGATMTDLVVKAKKGDDKAFCNAVQVDRTVLFDIPYFTQRLIRIQLGDEKKLQNDLANAIKGKVLGHKFPHRKLWLVFAMLDDEGFLNMPLDKLLDICTDLGVHGGISDPNTLGKRRKEYLSRKGSLI